MELAIGILVVACIIVVAAALYNAKPSNPVSSQPEPKETPRSFPDATAAMTATAAVSATVGVAASDDSPPKQHAPEPAHSQAPAPYSGPVEAPDHSSHSRSSHDSSRIKEAKEKEQAEWHQKWNVDALRADKQREDFLESL